MTLVYGSRPTSTRRTKAQMAALRDGLFTVLAEDPPMTVRQVFYRLVSLGAIDKSESEYKAVVVRLLTDMRMAGALPFDWIADNTRWQRKPRTYSSLENALRRTAETYRRALWDDQPVYVEVWLEKDALAGVLYQETADWDVPLMVTRGYASLSYLYEAAQQIAGVGKPTYLYYCGDYDPSGLDIPRNVEQRLRTFAPDAEIHFERVAVTPAQIMSLGLPTRPTKKQDTRSKGFSGESVEVDAIPPRLLRALVRGRIEQHIDGAALGRLERIEVEERETLVALANQWEGRS